MKKYLILIIVLVVLIATASAFIILRKEKHLHKPIAVTNQPIKTNAWFSSLYQFPSQPMFVLPGAYKIDTNGILISYPKVSAQEKAVTAPFSEECIISRGKPVINAVVAHYGDWNVDIELTDSDGHWAVSFTQGSPIVYVSGTDNIKLHCDQGTATATKKDVLVQNGDHALLVAAKDVQMGQEDDSTYYLNSTCNLFRVSLLPDTLPETLTLFRELPWAPIQDTVVSWKMDQSTGITTTYTMKTVDDKETLYTIWPHQQLANATSQKIYGKYQTVNGELLLVKGKEFATTTAIPDLATNFGEVSDPQSRELIITQIDKDATLFLSGKNAAPEGVYYRGTWLGSLTSLIQLADLYKQDEVKQQLLDLLDKQMQSSVKNFKYDTSQQMIVAEHAEFGNEKGNDHHFHYGYYIRAAAILLIYRPNTLDWLEKPIQLLVDDIASVNRDSVQFPFLRTYSVFEGHSWADGYAKFDDGNDQESTSEALNAWYAILLWGRTTKNTELETRGTWLFSQELLGTRSYWYGDHNPFPDGYKRSLASIVWGGKREFATWFSADPMLVYGIQWLPITPASAYLSTISTLPLQLTELSSLNSDPARSLWGDLYTAAQSYVNPQAAKQNMFLPQAFEGTKLHSLFLQTLLKNSEQ